MFNVLRATVSLCSVFLLLPVAIASAADMNALVRDFSMVTGYVVQPEGKEYIIDLDARQQLVVGDLFSVVRPGEKIIHPVTKEVIGTLDTVKGLLQVTRIKSGYSFCRPLGGASDIQRGDVVRRYQNIDAEFWDYTNHGEDVFRNLRTQLPHLQWRDYAVTQKNKPVHPSPPTATTDNMFFIFTNQGLEIRTPDFTTVRSYPSFNESASTPPATMAAAPTASSSAIVQDSVKISRVSESEMGAYWTSPFMKGTPIGVEVGDFDGDSRQEIAVAFENRIEFYRLLKGNYQLLETVALGVSIRAYHLDGFDLKKNGRMGLFVSAVTGNGNLSGVFIEVIEGRYRISMKDIPWHLRRVTLPAEGPVLLAQNIGTLGRGFSGPIFRVKHANDKLVAGAPFVVPKKVNLYDFALIPGKDRLLFACLGDDDYLNIVTEEGRILGSSVDKLGGSESYLEMNEDVPSGGERQMLYIRARIEVNEDGEIIVPINSGLTTLSLVKTFTKSEIKALKWDGSSVREVWHTAPEKSYLADFRVADAGNEGRKKLVTVVSFPDFNPFTERKTVVHVYAMP